MSSTKIMHRRVVTTRIQARISGRALAALLVLAAVLPASAQRARGRGTTTAPTGPATAASAASATAPAYMTFTGSTGTPFDIIETRNIFDASRVPRTVLRNTGTVVRTPAQPTPDYIQCTGIMKYDRGPLAFFEGNRPTYTSVVRLSNSIAGFQLTSIGPDFVTLASNSNHWRVPVGAQLSQDRGGPWRVVTNVQVAMTSTRPSDTSSTYSRNNGNNPRNAGIGTAGSYATGGFGAGAGGFGAAGGGGGGRGGRGGRGQGQPDMAGMTGMTGMDQPGMGQPGMGQPGMGQPGMGQPGMGMMQQGGMDASAMYPQDTYVAPASPQIILVTPDYLQDQNISDVYQRLLDAAAADRADYGN